MFYIVVRALDKYIFNLEEFLDSEDEGDNRRDIYIVKEGNKRKRRKGIVILVEKMVVNGVENYEDIKFLILLNDMLFLKGSIFFVEEKEKFKILNEIFKEGLL